MIVTVAMSEFRAGDFDCSGRKTDWAAKVPPLSSCLTLSRHADWPTNH